MLIMKFCYHGSNFRRKFQAVLEYAFRRSDKNTSLLPSPPLSNDEVLNNIEHSMSIRNLIFGINSVTVSYLIRFDSLLQNATATLLQNATEVYYKMRQVFYYKMRRLLQIATVH